MRTTIGQVFTGFGTPSRMADRWQGWWEELPARHRRWWSDVLLAPGEGWLRIATGTALKGGYYEPPDEVVTAPPLRRLWWVLWWWDRSCGAASSVRTGGGCGDDPTVGGSAMSPAPAPGRVCLDCGARVDDQTSLTGKPAPKDGDVSVCAHCGALAIFAANAMRLRRTTDAEALGLAANAEVQFAVLAVRLRVRPQVGDTLGGDG